MRGTPDPSLTRASLGGRDHARCPFATWRRLTDAGPVHPVQFPAVHAWLVTGDAAAREALTDDRLGKEHTRANEWFLAHASLMPEPQRSRLQVHLLHVDGERHRAMRPLVSRHLTPQRCEALRPQVRAEVERLMGALPERVDDHRPVDLVATVTAQLPLRVLALAIGLPEQWRDAFCPDWGRVVGPVGPHHPERATYERRVRALEGFIAGVVGADLAPDSMLAGIVAAARTGRITPAERDSMIFQLLAAGQDPVTAQLGLCLLDLLDHPEVAARMRKEPGALERGVEELLRHDPAFALTTWRFFDRDTAWGDVEVPAGDSVLVSLGAANRDPARWPEPDDLDLDRDARPHLTFGLGRHVCPGAALARVQVQEALRGLLRLRGLRATVGRDELVWSSAPLTRGVAALPVAWDGREEASR